MSLNTVSRAWLIAVLALAAAIAVTAVTILPVGASAHAQRAKPTIVLVHGAFADASGWADVTARLQRQGYTVVAPANPLRGITPDAAYLRTFLTTITGPIVLVGHSYGGAVITNAATANPNVEALVYVAAYAPDEGETLFSLGEHIPGGMIGPPTLTFLPFPLPDGSLGTEGVITPTVYREIFAADLPARQTDVMATAQRPVSLQALGEPSGPPAWKTIKSWYLLPTKDLAIGTDLERFMAERMHATTVEVKGASHAVMISRPQETARLILIAASAD